jgi:vacuolar-type H+-ATPase subunit E/Vma4
MSDEVRRSADKAEEQARRIEARLSAVKPRVDLMTAFKRSLTGGNHGTAAVSATVNVEEQVTPTQRIVRVIESTARRVREEAQRETRGMTEKQRKEAADDMRAAADRVEKGH